MTTRSILGETDKFISNKWMKNYLNIFYYFYYSCHLVRHPARSLSCTYLWKISDDKRVLFIYSMNSILLVDFYIPDFSWHMTEKFNNNGEVASGSSSNHHAMKNRAVSSFASTVTKRLQEKSFFLKLTSCLVLHCKSTSSCQHDYKPTSFWSGGTDHVHQHLQK